MVVGFRAIPEKSVSWGQNAIDIKLSWWGCEQRIGMYWGGGGIFVFLAAGVQHGFL
jgi:hypothetical protein